MVQVYFLLIVVNILGGLALASAFLGEKLGTEKLAFLQLPAFRKILGVISAIAGLIGLLSVLPGDLPIIGNLLPALSAILVGVGLFLETQEVPESAPEWSVKLQAFLETNGSLVGMAAIALGLLHFIFPAAVLL